MQVASAIAGGRAVGGPGYSTTVVAPADGVELTGKPAAGIPRAWSSVNR